MTKWTNYLELTKPRMVAGNVFIAFAAFIFGSQTINWTVCICMLAGLALVIASGTALNNYWDRDIDARMPRTKNRSLPARRIPPSHALMFGSVLFLLGFSFFFFLPITYHLLPTAWAFIGWISYVCFYTPLKHHSAYSLFVGAIAGATPVVIGYTAATGVFDIVSCILFVVLFLWQLPHFIGISLYRFDEYTAAEVPLFIKHSPSPSARLVGRRVFFSSLVILLIFSLSLLTLHFLPL